MMKIVYHHYYNHMFFYTDPTQWETLRGEGLHTHRRRQENAHLLGGRLEQRPGESRVHHNDGRHQEGGRDQLGDPPGAEVPDRRAPHAPRGVQSRIRRARQPRDVFTQVLPPSDTLHDVPSPCDNLPSSI